MAKHEQTPCKVGKHEFSNCIPHVFYVNSTKLRTLSTSPILSRYARQLFDVLSPYIHLYIDEFSNKVNLYKNDDFTSIQAYLAENGSKNAKRLRLPYLFGEKRILCMDVDKEMTDNFDGITVWWKFRSRKKTSKKGKYYELIFHKKHRELITGKYLDHVIKEGKNIIEKNRTRKLYLNKVGQSYNPESLWNAVEFNHPATFDTLALDPEKKREIIADRSLGIVSLFTRGLGRRGSGVTCFTLRKLLINTTSRSIIAIEDIDCSVDLTGKREESSKTGSVKSAGTLSQGRNRGSSVTLSGLLNFVDVICSSLGGERIIVFTTNSVAKLDSALIREGRMDKHIKLSYCGFEGFKVLAKNYLLIEEHSKFDAIKDLLEVTKITPADVDQDAKKAALEKRRMEKKAKEEAEAAAAQLQEVKETTNTKIEEAC
uniref:ATPase AAA-type core domain-containing protein n=1 Tax=Chenopodium quinoa TaxID=63459 RepID=A0A803M1D3_CHEQI